MAETPPAAREREVPDEALMRVLDEAIDLGVTEAYLVGGEVLVRRDLALALMRRIKAAGLRGELTTNGMLLRPDVSEELVGMGWDFVQVSVDGPDASLHDGLRGVRGSFDRIVSNIGGLVEAKARAGVDAPRLGLSTVVSNRNFRALADMVALAARLGASEATFQSLKPMSRHCGGLSLDPAQAAETLEQAEHAVEVAARLGVRTNARDLTEGRIAANAGRLDVVLSDGVHDTRDPLLGAHCFLPWYNLVVHWDGRVDPCWEWDGEPMGDARTQRLADIWWGEKFEQYRERFRSRDVPSHCARCCLGYLDHTRWLRLKALVAAGEWTEVLTVADGLLAHQPEHPAALEARLQALYRLGRRDSARLTLDRVFGTGRGAWPEELLLALFVPHREGDRGAVLAATDRVLATAPDEAYAWWVRGAAQHKLGRLREARASLERAAAGRCGSFRDAVFDSLAEVALDEGRPKEAVRWADRALAVDPRRTGTRRTRCRALRAMRA